MDTNPFYLTVVNRLDINDLGSREDTPTTWDISADTSGDPSWPHLTFIDGTTVKEFVLLLPLFVFLFLSFFLTFSLLFHLLLSHIIFLFSMHC